MKLPAVLPMDSMDLIGPWNNFIGVIPGKVLTIAGAIGIALLVVGIFTWVWQARKGGNKKAGIALVGFGALLAGPKFIIPVILLLLQVIITVAIAIIRGLSGLG